MWRAAPENAEPGRDPYTGIDLAAALVSESVLKSVRSCYDLCITGWAYSWAVLMFLAVFALFDGFVLTDGDSFAFTLMHRGSPDLALCWIEEIAALPVTVA